MKKTSFTKGQWIAVGRRVEHPNDRIPDICSCNPADFGQDGRTDEEACANARLIAAAPTMLNALWVAKYAIEADIEAARLTRDSEDDEIVNDAIADYEKDLDVIEDAIQLAIGEQP